MLRPVAIFALAIAATGCVSTKTLPELRASPTETYFSGKSVDAVTQCMRDLPTDMLETVTYPEGQKVEFLVGSPKDTVYLATATKNGEGTTITIHTHGRSLWAMPESQFNADVRRCAPPTNG